MTEATAPSATTLIATPLELIKEASAGRMFILLNHERAKSIGALIAPSQNVDASVINFMATHGRGLVYLTLTEERGEALGLRRLPSRNKQEPGAAFTMSIEARDGISTGISAFDRAHTIHVATDPDSTPGQIVTPGHVFPLLAMKGGVLIRPGVTEASVDICRLAGVRPSAVICEVLGEDGDVADAAHLMSLAQKHGLKIGTLFDLIAYRRKHDSSIVEVGRDHVTSAFGGTWTARRFCDSLSGNRHIALTKGDLTAAGPVMVRVHVLDAFTDVLGIGSGRRQTAIRAAMERIDREGRGVVVLLNSAAFADVGPDSNRLVEDFGLGAQILAAMGLTDMNVLVQTSLPQLINLDAFGLRISCTEKLALSP